MPYPVAGAAETWLGARGWEPPLEVHEAMNCVSPTVLGGTKLKQSPDFGQRKTAVKWGKMGLVKTRWGEASPAPDHTGPILPANGFIAALQGFPSSWPFRGDKHAVYRQIGNAFPPVVAMHLGCAVATALTGTRQDPGRYTSMLSARWRLPPVCSTNADGTLREPTVPASALLPNVRQLPLDRLAATSSMATRETEGEFPHESVYGPYEGDNAEEREAEHYVWYWEELREEHAAELEAAQAQATSEGPGTSPPEAPL